jgi:DNA-binding CsgD family transcriptional regulator
MKISEIANYLQLSPQTVKNTLGTALKKVKAYLRQQGLTS